MTPLLRRIVLWVLIVFGTTSIPLLPLVVLGLSFEEQVEAWLTVPLTTSRRFWLIVGMLSTDLILPIPSSAVTTYGGGRLGFGLALVASWLGMTIGGLVGYVAGRWLGRPVIQHYVKAQDIDVLNRMIERRGPWAVAMTRPLPILAEACVLIVGVGNLPLGRFLGPLVTGNLLVSVIYAAFGAYFPSRDAMPYAIVFAAVMPLIVVWLARWILRGRLTTRADNRVKR